MSAADEDDWWEVVPCHFIWDLETKTLKDFRSIVNNLDSKLETRKEVQWSDSACDLLLFRGYLEVSSFSGVQRDPQKAEKFFSEAMREAATVTDDLERRAYTTVATANRLWVLKQNQETLDKRKDLLDVLRQSWKDCCEEASRGKLQAYVDVIAAFALSRLGMNKYKEAERRYQHAIKILGQSTKSSWYQSLGELIGRQSRNRAHSTDDYDQIHDEVRCFEKALEIDPTNDSARCDLSLALLRIPERKEEAYDTMEQAAETYCEIFIKKVRFYRRLEDYGKCLELLKEGEKLEHPRAELFYQYALIYGDMATREKEYDKKKRHLVKESLLLNKCLRIDQAHFAALLQ